MDERTTGVKPTGLQRRLNPVAPLAETDKYLVPFPRMVWLHQKRPSGKGKVTVKGNWDRTHQFRPSGSKREWEEKCPRGVSILTWNQIGPQGWTSWRTKQHPSIFSDSTSQILKSSWPFGEERELGTTTTSLGMQGECVEMDECENEPIPIFRLIDANFNQQSIIRFECCVLCSDFDCVLRDFWKGLL